jgi:glycogen debranching enzyme
MRLGREVLRDLTQSSAVEWLETDGLGGFAMGTAAGMNTRRYHGWCVSLRPPVDRYVLVSRLEESVGGVELAVNQYPGAIHPRGHERLVAFTTDPCPTWTWELGDGLELTRQLYLVRGARTLCVRYAASRPCTVRVKPLLAFRDYHGLQRGNDALNRDWVDGRVRPYAGLPELCISHSGTVTREGEGWFWNTEYELERRRGLDFKEDLWCPGTIVLEVGSEARVDFSVGPPGAAAPRAVAPADAFRVTRDGGQPTIIAGYPWFTDWGRDSMISLRGLLIGRGMAAEARAVIAAFLAHLDGGLIPNRFPDRGERPEYNTSDATLWMFEAVHALGDDAFVRDSFFERGREIIAAHEAGTHFGLHVDRADGLLVNGPQTTWMDAVVNGQPATPRAGKAVEINALWFNALKLMERWARGLSRPELARDYAEKAARVAESFRAAFWNGESLFDLARVDPAVRPNQLVAAALACPVLSPVEAQPIVRTCERQLLTPFGLRTLAPGSPGYRGRFEGGPVERDTAYHQGTVWPWLIGSYVDAYLYAFGKTDALRAALDPLLNLLEQRGTLPEVFDGDAPQRAGGTPAQAWSVAEVLRAAARMRGTS